MATYFRIAPRTLKKSLLRASFSKNLQVSIKVKSSTRSSGRIRDRLLLSDVPSVWEPPTHTTPRAVLSGLRAHEKHEARLSPTEVDYCFNFSKNVKKNHSSPFL